MTASATEVVNTEKLGVVKGTCDVQVEAWELLFWSHLGVSCLFFMKISSWWGTYWSFLKHWSPVRQPQQPEMGDWGTELGAACFLVASDTLWGVWFDTARWLYDVVP